MLCKWLKGLLIGACLATAGTAIAAPGANLDQVINGAMDSPIDPPDWVNGNANAQKAHYKEALSIPYRVIMTEMPLNTSITITLAYDTKRSGKHAIDYLTHYQRLEPHQLGFGHPAETVNPLLGVAGVSATVSTFAIPTPQATVNGLPASSFLALPANERLMTLFGGTITGISYGTQGSLNNASASSQIKVTFKADSATAVLSWGGHIASRLDWGLDTDGTSITAAGISGSSYHMNLVSWTLGSLGSQDRSLSAGAVIVPAPSCSLPFVEGSLCVNNDFDGPCVDVMDGMPPFDYAWIGPNGFASDSPCLSVPNAQLADAGVYSLIITDSRGEVSDACTFTLNVNGGADCSISGAPSVCEGESTTWCGPDGVAAYEWTLPDGTNEITQCIEVSVEGEYDLKLTTSDGCESTCSRTLTVNALPACEITGAAAVCSGSDTQWCGPEGMASYEWTLPDGSTQTTRCIDVSAAGEYSLTIVDSNACTSSCNRTLIVNALPGCAITGADEICNDGSSTEYCASDGMAAYAWTLPDGSHAASRCVTAQMAGAYHVTITDENGCQSSCSKSLTVNELPPCSIMNVPPMLIGPEGMSGFSWKLPDGSVIEGADKGSIQIAMSGTYELTVTDANGCESTCTQSIEAPTCQATPPVTEVCDGGTAQFSVLGSGGTGAYTYSWTGPGGFTANTETIEVGVGGIYEVTVIDENLLSSTPCQVELIVHPNPEVEIEPMAKDLMCYESGNVLTASIASGGTPPYAYSWSVDCADWSIDSGVDSNQITFTAGGGVATLTVTVIDAYGCMGSDQITLSCPFREPYGLHCSLTQGAYGNAGGKYGGVGTLDLIASLLAQGDLMLGLPGRSLTFKTNAAQCIIDLLPAGGPSKPLSSSTKDATIGDPPACETPKSLPTFPNNGKIRNVFVGQMTTLSLNVRWDPSLLTFELPEEPFCTHSSIVGPDGELIPDPGDDGVYGCFEGENDDPVSSYTIPASVLLALDNAGLPRTVEGLLALGNKALAGQSVSADINDINAAVSIINDAFDECAFIVDCP